MTQTQNQKQNTESKPSWVNAEYPGQNLHNSNKQILKTEEGWPTSSPSPSRAETEGNRPNIRTSHTKTEEGRPTSSPSPSRAETEGNRPNIRTSHTKLRQRGNATKQSLFANNYREREHGGRHATRGNTAKQSPFASNYREREHGGQSPLRQEGADQPRVSKGIAGMAKHDCQH